LNLNKWIRQIHRWLSVVFTVAVIANIVVNIAGAGETLALRIGLLTLIPLALLMLTGLYLFVLPHVARWRGGPPAGWSERGGE